MDYNEIYFVANFWILWWGIRVNIYVCIVVSYILKIQNKKSAINFVGLTMNLFLSMLWD